MAYSAVFRAPETWRSDRTQAATAATIPAMHSEATTSWDPGNRSVATPRATVNGNQMMSQPAMTANGSGQGLRRADEERSRSYGSGGQASGDHG